MECAQCGAQVTAGRKSCAACGAPVARTEIVAGPEDVEAMLAEANLYRSRGQFEEAVSACMRILQRDANHAAAHSLIADIYRDQGNYREALNWFKLAVELDPDNEADKRKLDEMIDRVFQGVLAGELRSSVKAMAQSPSPSGEHAAKQSKVSFKAFLARVQPVYAAVGFAVIISGLLIFFVIIPSWNKHADTNTATNDNTARSRVERTASNSEGMNARATAENIEPVGPRVTPPAPDAVENGDTRPKAVDGLPGIVIDPNPGNLTAPPKPAAGDTPAAGIPPAQDNNESSATATPQVPPLSPLTAAGSPADRIELQTLLLKMTLERAVVSSKLPSELNAVTLDPRTNAVTIKFTIPRMKTATETKQGLLYTGFHLIWTAAEQNEALTGFTLHGNAYTGAEKDPSLALFADVTLEQAESARAAADYKKVLQYLTKPWWRADLADAPL